MTIKQRVKNALLFERVVAKRDGTFEVRDGYFYRFERSAGKLADKIVAILREHRLDATIIKVEDHWNQWPKASFFLVRFSVVDVEEVANGVLDRMDVPDEVRS